MSLRSKLAKNLICSFTCDIALNGSTSIGKNFQTLFLEVEMKILTAPERESNLRKQICFNFKNAPDEHESVVYV